MPWISSRGLKESIKINRVGTGSEPVPTKTVGIFSFPMGIPDHNILSPEIAQALLDKISSGSLLLDIQIAPGSYSNFTHLLTAQDTEGSEFRIVVRRYRVFGHYDRGQKARREFTVLQCACRNGIPAPQPLYLDETGDLLGILGIVTRYVPGTQVETPADPIAWARTLAETLAKIHATQCDPVTRGLLLDANAEATWFIRSERIPDYMSIHPDGDRVWQVVRSSFPGLQAVPATLVHLDYWPGNVLWEGDRIAAVVDWEEAAFGDPTIDVAYCRMDMILSGLPKAADEFLSAYQSATSHHLANLGFWELAAAARPMFSPQGWVDQSPAKERFAQFIAGAMEKHTGER
jgi:aminoglycoside phosphotransferase (APT) family kinase protein